MAFPRLPVTPSVRQPRPVARACCIATLVAGLLLVGNAPSALAQEGPMHLPTHSITGRILGFFPVYRDSTPAARPAPRSAGAGHITAAAGIGASATQAGRADADPDIADNDLDTLRLLQLQSIGCVALGVVTSVAAVVTFTAATAVQGGAPLPFLGEVVAGFVTFFSSGCAVGALVILGLTLFESAQDLLLRRPD